MYDTVSSRKPFVGADSRLVSRPAIGADRLDHGLGP